MNPYTGELRAFANAGVALVPDFERIPQELERAAVMKLAGAKVASVSLTSGGKLSNWAKAKRKAKMAQASKRRNRK